MTFIVRSEKDSNIWVSVLKDSISPEGDRLFTIHAHYPRIVHAEVMTHTILTKNATSSRAVPVSNFLETIENNPFIPTFIGKNQSGMVAGEDISEAERKQAVKLIKNHLKSTIKFVRKLSDKDGLNLHKQIPNRYTEAFQYMNTIISGTEWHGQIGNFFKLRNHPDAEPHFQELAKCIQQAYDTHKPELLYPGEWHLPFINTERDDNGTLKYGIIESLGEHPDGTYTPLFNELSLEDAKRISASCAAQISYRKGDTSLEKAKFVWDKLIHNKPEHSSPLQHQGTPIDYNLLRDDEKKAFDIVGITHMDRRYNLWSAQFKGWIMFRKEWEHQQEIIKRDEIT